MTSPRMLRRGPPELPDADGRGELDPRAPLVDAARRDQAVGEGVTRGPAGCR